MIILQVKKNYFFFQSQMTDQAKFTYSLLEKVFEKQTKVEEDQEKEKKKVKTLQTLKNINQQLTIKGAIPEDQLKEEAKKEILKKEKLKKKKGKNGK